MARKSTSNSRALRELREFVLSLPAPRVPSATYRLQFNAGFTFRDAEQLAPYLHDLGISDVYASPYLKARSGSTHGYDVADPSVLNPELGTEKDYAAFAARLRELGMGQLVDVVPNHMGIGDPGNFRWVDVLENGPASVYAGFFDINWQPLKAELRDENKLILPVLGDQYGKVLENGELRVERVPADGSFRVAYWDHQYPLAPDTYPHVLEPTLEIMQDSLGRKHEHVQELASILTAVRHLPPRQRGLDRDALEERAREKEIVKRRLWLLHEASAPYREALDEALATVVNGTPGQRASFDRMDALLDEQSYRLAYWRVASEEINYRRFFDVAELAAVRMENPEVFRETHALLLRLVGMHTISGLRIDHPDGLLDPNGYFWELQQAAFVRLYTAPVRDALDLPDTAEAERRLTELFNWERERHAEDPSRSPLLKRFYVVVEKILGADEPLPPTWPVHGTTGYAYMNVLNGIFVAQENERAFELLYQRFVDTGDGYQRFDDMVNAKKKQVMLISLASEVNELGYMLKRLASRDRRHRDFTLNLLTFAIREVIAALPVYRTYVDPKTGEMSGRDVRYVEEAVAEAKRRNPRTDPSLFDYLRDTLLLRLADQMADDPNLRSETLRFIARFQQTSGPVMAKGVEDTSFYLYNRLISLNEVGGEPARFGVSVAQFHRDAVHRSRHWPTALLSTSTHDTKRSEDVRARIDVLSELPREWRAAVGRWSRMNRGKKEAVGRGRGAPAPDRNEEYLLYQTLLGAWPLEGLDGEEERTAFTQRIQDFMLKAMREGKVNTSWVNQNAAYEEAVQRFVARLLDPSESAEFLADFARLQRVVSHFGLFNGLTQTLVKMTAPGVPDIYQGTEVWDFSLVDPDNRRPVDYARRASLLHTLKAGAPDPADLLAQREDGRLKMLVIQRALALRREQPTLFTHGAYKPLRVVGAGGGRRDPLERHVVSFARTSEGTTIVAAGPLLLATLLRGATETLPLGERVWGTARLEMPAAGTYEDCLSGATLRTEGDGRPTLALAEVFGALPVGLLRRTRGAEC